MVWWWWFIPGFIISGRVTIKFQSESLTFNKWLESSLVSFHAHDFLDGPRKDFKIWVGALRWHRPSRCHSRKLLSRACFRFFPFSREREVGNPGKLANFRVPVSREMKKSGKMQALIVITLLATQKPKVILWCLGREQRIVNCFLSTVS